MESEILILGAGLTGLAAGVELKERATIVEREKRPGGLVRSKCFNGGYWFDNVLHILHFNNKEIQARIQSLVGTILEPCPPVAWIECKEGVVRYPFQLNLGALNEEAKFRCVYDYAKAYFTLNQDRKYFQSYKEYLKATFGEAMCELFYFPYNNKQWKYPLEYISSKENLWNIHRPTFHEVLSGVFSPNQQRETYNTNAYYPRPLQTASLRGMEILSQALAKKVHRLDLNRKIIGIEGKSKRVWVQFGSQKKYYSFSKCFSTIPIPILIDLCLERTKSLSKESKQLRYNKVISIGFSIKGPRPQNPGHWRYYTDPKLPFTRLVFMTEFDTHNAPPEGWSLLVEITWPGKKPLPQKEVLLDEVITGLLDLNLINNKSSIIGKHMWVANPAYVIFTPESQRIVDNCKEFVEKFNITPSGRYGKWEYSSMFQNISDGFTWAKNQ